MTNTLAEHDSEAGTQPRDNAHLYRHSRGEKRTKMLDPKLLKSTIRLPKSKFLSRPRPESIPIYTRRCCDNLYAWQLSERPANSTFTLHDGPPYANGDLHVGHALNKITKDIICRSKLAEGKRVNYIPGWDCHGLPIELKAFEKNGWERGAGVNPVKIRAAAKAFAAKAVTKQMEVFRSWAIMADWDNHWKTMDKDFELRQLEVFKAMASHGLIVRRHKPVYWSPSSQTALAEAEIERDEVTSTAAVVKFRIPAVIGGIAEPVHAVIWTTTPWTLPANQAIAINKDFKYVLIRSAAHGVLVCALSRVEYLSAKLKEEVKILQIISAETLLECTYSGLAQFGEEALNRPFIHADFVTEEDGTGLVHCAPGHGQEDFEALQEHIKSGRVVVKAPVNDRGEYTDAASPAEPSLLSGQYVFKEGNKTILSLLGSANALITSYDFKHKYPIDWRTKQPIMIRATAQWFADISKIKEDVIASLDQVSFRPETGKARLKSFVETRTEWCISRQRAWGVPIPALYHKETGEAVLTDQSIEHIISVIQERGINAWWSDDPHDPAWVMPGLDADSYVRGKDTMDVWFDSGSSWSLLAKSDSHQPNTPVADVYLEGSDQHRGWFQSSILTYIAYQKANNPRAQVSAPFRQLATHGFTLDGQGKKMSKSIGNVVSPTEIIEGLSQKASGGKKTGQKSYTVASLGPDALRLWAATGDWTSDVVISQNVIYTVHKSLEKYRITMKVVLGMLADFDPANLVSYEQMMSGSDFQHRIALFQLYKTAEGFRNAMQNYEFHKALSIVNEWIAKDFSGFYIESIKDMIYCDSLHSQRRLVTQTVLFHVMQQFQHMLAPITPLMIEEMHEHTPTLIQEHVEHPLRRIWSPLPAEWNDASVESSMDAIMCINSAVKVAQEQARLNKVLGSSLACEVEIEFSPTIQNEAVTQLPPSFWEQVLVVSKVHLSPQSLDKKWVYQQSAGDDKHIANVYIHPPTEEKCARCWTFRALEPPVKEEVTPLCTRCTEVVDEALEAQKQAA